MDKASFIFEKIAKEDLAKNFALGAASGIIGTAVTQPLGTMSTVQSNKTALNTIRKTIHFLNQEGLKNVPKDAPVLDKVYSIAKRYYAGGSLKILKAGAGIGIALALHDYFNSKKNKK